VTFSHAGSASLRYGGMRISDAGGRALSGGLELRNGSLLVHVGTRGARYPLRIDPFIQQAEKLAGSGQAGAPVPRLGMSVALSADGNTALVGGPGDYGKTGAAWVFTRSGSTWTQQGSKLTAAGEQGEGQFGSSVALSPTGNTALVGGPGDAAGLGAAWVFTRTGSTWTQQGPKLTGGSEEVSSGAAPRPVRLERRARRRRKQCHRAGRRAGRQQRPRRGVGVHAHWLDLGPARVKAHRRRRRGQQHRSSWQVRGRRGAVRHRKQRHRADRRPW
jgi:hypothetical protein